MIPRPCPTHLTCQEGDFPTINYSSEAPDPFTFLGVAFGSTHCAGVGSRVTFMWGSSFHYCFSGQSQADAILCAKLGAQNDCTATFDQAATADPFSRGVSPGDPSNPRNPALKHDSPTPNANSAPFPFNPPISDDPRDPAIIGNPPELFFNNIQTCQACCQGGPCASYSTTAGIFPGSTQAESDLWASVYACRQAILQLPAACRPPLPAFPPPVKLKNGNPATPVFWNDPQTCSSQCPDGTSATFTTPAAKFSATTQNAANARANSFACQQARLARICFSPMGGTICVGVAASLTTNVTSVNPMSFALIGGIPPGMTLEVSDRSATVTGTPTTPGNYTFSLNATDGTNSAQKQFTISVLGITNSPPPGSLGSPYNFVFSATGGTAPYTYAITNGSLPLGLSMSSLGVISGTPTAAATNSFQVTVTDSGP